VTWIDCNVKLGRLLGDVSVQGCVSKEELLHTMRACKVDRAICHMLNTPRETVLRRTMSECTVEGSPIFYFTRTTVPGLQIRPKEAHCFPGLRLMTISLDIGGASYAADSMWNAACKLACPVFAPLAEIRMEELYRLAGLYPNVPVIVTDFHYRDVGSLVTLLAQRPNLYLETSGCRGFGSIEMICRSLGVGRLVFGSRYPLFDMGSAKTMIMLAAISPHEKERIASENIRDICWVAE